MNVNLVNTTNNIIIYGQFFSNLVLLISYLALVKYLIYGNKHFTDIFHLSAYRTSPTKEEFSEWVDFTEISINIKFVPLIVIWNYIILYLWLLSMEILFGKYNYLRILLLTVLIPFAAYFPKFLSSSASKDFYNLSSNFMILFVCGIFGTSLVNICHYFHRPGPILSDIGFTLIPENLNYEPISDYILIFEIIVFVSNCLLCSPNVRNKILIDFARMESISVILKGFIGFWTSLPGPAKHCRIEDIYHPNSLSDIFLSQGQLVGNGLHCGDLIYSGHTATLIIILLCRSYIMKYSHKNLFKYYACVIMGLFSYYCLAARKHYTIDIITGIFAGFSIFYVFRNGWLPSNNQSIDNGLYFQNRFSKNQDDYVDDD